MIQRIQSVFLLLASAAGLLTFFFPIANFFSDNYSIQFSVMGIEKFTDYSDDVSVNTIPLMCCSAMIVILPFITIFLYKRRYLQIRITRFTIFLDLIFLALVFFYYVPNIEEVTLSTAEYIKLVGIYLPLLSLILLILAIRFISKDEKKIRAADRIR